MSQKVSIITPTYNHEMFISQCIQSVIDQSYSDWELIIVDDGSTDGTKSMINKFKDERIKYIYQQNKGIQRLHETYNTALKEAKGDFIAILEGDDYWAVNKLEQQIKLFTDKNIDLVWGQVEWVDINGNYVATMPEEISKYRKLNRFEYINKLLIGNFIPAVTVVIKKSRLMANGGFHQPPNMVTVDYPTWLECIKDGEVAVIEATVGFWRRHSTQMSTARQHEILNNTMSYAIDYYNTLPHDFKSNLKITSDEIAETWCKHISESCFYEGRKKLVRKQWGEAKNDFANAYKLGSNVCKAKSILGIIAAYSHNDIELIVKLSGKSTISHDELCI